tara:strand:+ start:558 stop:1103 length:546 start_codon:yes stop_codon:yes gene_type:complete
LAIVPGAQDAHAEDGSVGVMVDAGLPDGVSGSLVWRMSPRIRVHGGVGYNGFAPGVRAGFSVAAFPFFITPTATVEAGRFFEGDANTLAQMVSGDSEFDEPALREVGYDFANAHVGLELGYSGMTFYVHGGMSALQMRVRNLNATLDANFDESDGPKLELRSDPTLRVIGPSARAGFVYYF